MYLTVNGVRLFFDTVGAGLAPSGLDVVERPTIILLHGGPGMDHMVFRPALDDLSHQFQVIYVDQRGCGRSDAGPKSGWNLRHWADDIAELIRQLGIVKPIVMGTSFGGMVVQRLAVDHQDLLGGIVLMSTASRSCADVMFATMESRCGPKARRAAEHLFSNPDEPGVREAFGALCTPFYASRGLVPGVLERVISCLDVNSHFISEGGEIHRLDFRPDLAKLQLASLVIHGADDPIFPPAMSRETFAALGSERKRIVEIDRCSHFVEQDAPEIIIQSIADFFLNGKE